MFVRDNTTCTSCEECRTFDLYNASGWYGNSEDGPSVLFAIRCIKCEALTLCSLAVTTVEDLVLRTRQYLPSSSSWCHYVDAQSLAQARLRIQDRRLLMTWILSSGFRPEVADPALVDAAPLKTLVSTCLILAVYADAEYPIVVFPGVIFPDDQPLAS